MSIRFSLILLMLAIFTSLSFNVSRAAFPSASQSTATIVKEQKVIKQSLKQTLKQYKNTAAPRTTGMGSADAFGIVALVAGILGAILLFTPAAIATIPLAVCALIFGILGLKGSNQGMAIAGLVLGAVEILIIVAAIILVAAWLSAL